MNNESKTITEQENEKNDDINVLQNADETITDKPIDTEVNKELPPVAEIEKVEEPLSEIIEESEEEEKLDNKIQEDKHTDDSLKKENENLREELEIQKHKLSEFVGQLKELYELFPDANVSSISEEVWQNALNGIPIAAAYALNLRRTEIAKQRADEANKSNKDKCVGGIRGISDNGCFSPSEVKKMTPSQVRENYTKIIDSMNHWN